MADKIIYYDGMKSIELSQYPEDAWTYLTGEPDSGQAGIKDYFKAIPWLYRGVNLRANAVASMPFEIYKGDGEESIDDSKDYQNVVGFLPNPQRTFKLVEMSLSLMGRSYLFNVQNNVVTLDLKYLNPTTIQPKIDEKEGLVGFIRTLTTQTFYEEKYIVHFWLEDPYIEMGEPKASPATAALMASGVLANTDEFVAGFFKRGAVKATIFTALGMSPEKANKLEAWWKRFIGGGKNAWSTKIIQAESLKPVVIGEGLESLQNYELTKEKREDISTALGIPQTKLWSSEAGGLGGGGVVSQDDLTFYNETVVPECEFIQSVLNVQVFEPMGYRLKFMPETLDIYQEDEKERGEAVGFYVQAGMPLDIACRVLGVEMTDEEWARVKAEMDAKRERQEAMAQVQAQASAQGGAPDRPVESPPNTQGNLRSVDMDKWQRKALNSLERGKPAACEFESDYIDEVTTTTIFEGLQTATDADTVKSVFENVAWTGGDSDQSPLIDALIDATRAMRETDPIMVDGALDGRYSTPPD